ncbi:VF530 family protein [uncultured Arcticibacterium sp.]|uniref:VF530 family protein n=1 Tax=uncultured Arcticibacterium sp. TaxID=2173042 RepID=UPI0030F5087E
MKKGNPESQPNNPLHGVRLDFMLDTLVDHFGWGGLGKIIKINCFNNNPTMKSSLTFLRKTDWARKKVEDLYLEVASRE